MLHREQIIKQIEANIDYYNQFVDDGADEAASYSIEALNELLYQIIHHDEVFDPVNDPPFTVEELKKWRTEN